MRCAHTPPEPFVAAISASSPAPAPQPHPKPEPSLFRQEALGSYTFAEILGAAHMPRMLSWLMAMPGATLQQGLQPQSVDLRRCLPVDDTPPPSEYTSSPLAPAQAPPPPPPPPPAQAQAQALAHTPAAPVSTSAQASAPASRPAPAPARRPAVGLEACPGQESRAKHDCDGSSRI